MTKPVKRKDGRWQVRIYTGTDKNTQKKLYKTVYGYTKKEVIEKAESVEVGYSRDAPGYALHKSFSFWTDAWFKRKQQKIEESLAQQYITGIKRVNLYLGNYNLDEITAYDVEDMLEAYAIENPVTGNPSSKRLLKMYRSVVDQVYRFAIRQGAATVNPAKDAVIPPDAPVKQRRPLTREEQELIRTTDHRMRTFALIMMYAGLRKGEVVPLTWNDIDLAGKTITVNKAVKFVKGKPEIKPPKTESGKRTVFIPDSLVRHLESVKPAKAKGKDLVCPSLNGEMFTKDSYSKAWKSYQCDLTIAAGKDPNISNKFDPKFKRSSDITAHMLRHTFCSELVMQGVNVKVAQNQLGHANVNTTLSIYTHVTEDFIRQEMLKISGI